MFSSNRETYRRVFLEAWQKAKTGQPLSALESQIVDILKRHPLQQTLLEADQDVVAQDFRPEQGQANPFLHLGLHLAVVEQLAIDQPPGIRQRYQALVQTLSDPHQAEHRVMECLAKALRLASQQAFDTEGYLDCIQMPPRPGPNAR